MIDLSMATTSDDDDLDAVAGNDTGSDNGPAVTVKPRSRLQAIADPSSYVPTYAGIVLTLAGFGLIIYGWAKVAGLTDVWRQMPFIVSTGFPGLGLVMSGLLVINIAAKRQDAAERNRQLDTLTDALHELRQTLEER